MAVINIGKHVTRYELETVARQNGGMPASHAQLDKYCMDGNPGLFWAREFAAKGILIENGRDLFCKNTKIIVEAKDVKKMLELHAALEAKLGQKILIETIFYFIDPENCTKNKNGLYVLEAPKITIVENAKLDRLLGKADTITKIAVETPDAELETIYSSNKRRWNFINNGIWPLSRGSCSNDCKDKDLVRGDFSLNTPLSVLIDRVPYDSSFSIQSLLESKIYMN